MVSQHHKVFENSQSQKLDGVSMVVHDWQSCSSDGYDYVKFWAVVQRVGRIVSVVLILQ